MCKMKYAWQKLLVQDEKGMEFASDVLVCRERERIRERERERDIYIYMHCMMCYYRMRGDGICTCYI